MKIEKAIKIIKGYCEKQIECKYCRFAYGSDFDCELRDIPPVDWNIPYKESED